MKQKTKRSKRRRVNLGLVLVLVIAVGALTACSCSGGMQSILDGIRNANPAARFSEEDEDERSSGKDESSQDGSSDSSDQGSSGPESDSQGSSDSEGSGESSKDDSSQESSGQSSGREDGQESSRTEEIVHREDPEQCQQFLAQFLDDYHNKEPEANEFLINGGSEEMSFDGFQGILAESFTYEIGSVDMSYTVPYVSVKITNIDFKKILETYIESLGDKDAASADAVVNSLTDLLAASDRPMRTFECSVPVYYLDEEGGLKIEMTEELSNALTGGFAEFISEYLWSGSGQDSQ